MRFYEAYFETVVFGIAMSVCMHALGRPDAERGAAYRHGVIAGGEFSTGQRLRARDPMEKPMHRVWPLDGFWMEGHRGHQCPNSASLSRPKRMSPPAEQAPKSTTSWRQLPPGSQPPPAEMLAPGRCL